jgi:hypothetical protein
MTNLSLSIRYRPVRIGWCVRSGNWDDLRHALRLTHIFWGGKFNPVIPVGDPSAMQLVRQFRVDTLFPVNASQEATEFTKQSQALGWPLLDDEIVDRFRNAAPKFLDISHPLMKIASELRSLDKSDRADDAPPQAFESSNYVIVHWDEDDPLADILLATFGGLPTRAEIGRDYEGFLLTNIRAFPYKARKNETLPAQLISRRSISDISAAELIWDRVPARSTMGFYAGRANDFEDVVNYWNLQAADLNVIFLDPSHAERMKEIRIAHANEIVKRYEAEREQTRGYATVGWDEDRIPVWSRSQNVAAALEFSKDDVPHFRQIDGTAIGAEVKPPLHSFQRQEVLGSVATRYGRPTLSFQLPEKPFKPDEFSQEHFVISIRTPFEDPGEGSTFWTPFVPELNIWYGQQLSVGGRNARAEIDGVGIVGRVRSETLALTSLRKTEIAKKLFELAGIGASLSYPGRIASRLISQLGGLQGCRVLKISGVRALIRKYSPLQEFDRTEAMGMIGDLDPETGTPRFGDYESLFIEERDWSTKLKPEDAFGYLLDRGVFRVGLSLTCPTCELPFWISLDDASTIATCEVCGAKFNVLRQLKTRDWKYRRSGIFGRDNHQEGSIPVALTLQQLHAQFHSWYGESFFLPNMKLDPLTANIEPCETDIFIAMQDGSDTVLAVGECKDAGGSITADDARKMAAISDALSGKGFECYIVFSKTAPFTSTDIENCRLANGRGRTRVVMLSNRELEPYNVYEKTSIEYEIRRGGGHSLLDMALATHDIFFAPTPKKISAGPTLA